MKFLVILALAGLVVAEYQVDPAKKAAAIKLLTMDAKDMHACKTDAECASVEGKPKCCEHLHLCKPEGSPSFERTTGTCTDDEGCPPIYRCKEAKCHFAGPTHCEKNEDCLQGTSAEFECKENAKSGPGKRCWRKCAADADCHKRMPEEAKSHLGCCHGNCQKKAAC